jgi:hypothetical protein
MTNVGHMEAANLVIKSFLVKIRGVRALNAESLNRHRDVLKQINVLGQGLTDRTT